MNPGGFRGGTARVTRTAARWLRHPGHAGWSAFTAVSAAVVLCAPVPWLEGFGYDSLIPVSFWASVAFVAYYSLLAPWWHNPMGRMLVALDVGIALALQGPVLTREFGLRLSTDVGVRTVAAGLIVIPATILSRTWLLGRLHGWKPAVPWRHRSREAGRPVSDAEHVRSD